MRWGYPLVEIGDLVSTVKKWNPRQSKTNELINYIDIASVNRETKEVENVMEVFAHEAPSRARQLVMDGDVLVSTVRPNLNAVAHLKTEFSGATASTGFTVLRPNSKKVCDRYLYYWVRSPYFVQDMIRRSTGASYPAVSDSIVKAYNIPLPPLEEQKRIAAILDKADAIRRKRQEAIRLTEELLRSTFLDMFGDPVINPKGWKIEKLKNITTKITDGVHQKPKYTNNGIPFISVKDITTGTLKFEDCKFISEEDHKKYFKRCNPEFGDILYTKVGATYGRPALVNIYDEFSLYVSVCLIKPIKEIVRPHFLKEAMATPAIKRQADRSIKGIGVPDLHLNMIKEFLLPVPNLKIQDEYLEKAKKIHRLQSVTELHSIEAENLFNSLLQKAFRGEL